MINNRHQGIPLRFLFRFYVPSTSIVRKYGVLTKGDKTFWTIPSTSSTYRHNTHTYTHTQTHVHSFLAGAERLSNRKNSLQKPGRLSSRGSFHDPKSKVCFITLPLFTSSSHKCRSALQQSHDYCVLLY